MVCVSDATGNLARPCATATRAFRVVRYKSCVFSSYGVCVSDAAGNLARSCTTATRVFIVLKW